MKRTLSILLLALPLADAVEVDVDAVGRDLNGWQGSVARYSTAGAAFEVGQPIMSWDESNNLIVEAEIREIRRSSPVYDAKVRLLVSPDGLVRRASVKGTVDGKVFDSGEVTRPEPAVIPEAPSAEEGAEGVGPVVDVAPTDPDEEMRQALDQQLVAAIERARRSEKVVKRDLSSWLLSGAASEGETLVEGTAVVVSSLFRRIDR
ncbi:hypothetical protein HAHE_10420 [Haloferula helveola]|uniref:Uncharacterized protein n=1 Tax=Haloferula helveola TaxID=490095 RepID=A0ABM7RJH1_9BACT|nr:hypothetical protein HAHE_10420 [Haloferula helveola]